MASRALPPSMRVSGAIFLLLCLLAAFMAAPGHGATLPAAARGTRPAVEKKATRPDSALMVLAAASLADVLPVVAGFWEEAGGMPVRFSFDGTSRLAPQTLQGIEADLFISADETWMDWVEDRGGLLEGTRIRLLGNRLVVVVPSSASERPAVPEDIDGRVHMRWSDSADSDVVGYQLWRRNEQGQGFEKARNGLVSYKNTEIDASVESEWGEDFYYAVQSLDRNENSSAFSSLAYEQRVLIGPHHELDYGDGLDPNTFGGNNGAWGTGGESTYVQTMAHHGKTSWVRRLSAATADAGGFALLNTGSITDYDGLTMTIKGAVGGELVSLGLKSTNGMERKVRIDHYIPGGSIPATWTEVRIPLIDFKQVDLDALDNISFTFGAAGTVYLDEIRFEKTVRPGDIVIVREGESADAYQGGDTNDFKWYASKTYTLGNSWAADAGDYATFTENTATPLNEAYLAIRYACGADATRTINILVNGVHAADIEAQVTGGWGDESWHFREDHIRLGGVPAGPLNIRLETPDAGSAVNLDRIILRSATHFYREAEDHDGQSGSGGEDLKAGARAGAVLGQSWGSANDSFAVYSNVIVEQTLTNAVLSARYGQDWEDGRLIRVHLNGTNMGSIAFANTGGWLDHFVDGGYAELPLGRLPAGTNTLLLSAEGSDQAVNLDCLRITDSSDNARAYDTDGDGIPDAQEALYGTATNLSDEDNDGLSDLEEISRIGGFLSDPHDRDGDEDGMDDGQELFAGTDPLNDQSLFILSAMEPYSGGIRLTWPGRTDRTYAVFYSDEDLGGDDGFTAVTNPGAVTYTNNYYRYTDDGAGTPSAPTGPLGKRRTYRISVRK